jgi:hypothetical protein
LECEHDDGRGDREERTAGGTQAHIEMLRAATDAS